jgi:hypothetical protein
MGRRVTLEEAFALSYIAVKVIVVPAGTDVVVAPANERRVALRIYGPIGNVNAQSIMINQAATSTTGIQISPNNGAANFFITSMRNDGQLPCQEYHLFANAGGSVNVIVFETLMPAGIELYGDVSSQSPGSRVPTM